MLKFIRVFPIFPKNFSQASVGTTITTIEQFPDTSENVTLHFFCRKSNQIHAHLFIMPSIKTLSWDAIKY